MEQDKILHGVLDLGPGDIVSDADLRAQAPATPTPKENWGTAAPNFLPMFCGQTARLLLLFLSLLLLLRAIIERKIAQLYAMNQVATW